MSPPLLPDFEDVVAAADRLAGRRTLAIRLGVDGSRAAYAAMLLAPFPIVLTDCGWLALLAAPMAVRLILAFATRERGPAFNLILAQTARFQLLLAVLVGVGAQL